MINLRERDHTAYEGGHAAFMGGSCQQGNNGIPSLSSLHLVIVSVCQ
jgi:hypothetical protein